jgi:4-hydroxy-3-methylbut-2-enyl diphosphate reductase
MENMKVLLASPRGFCAGVNMAIESLELALGAFGPPIYVYHEIVHNQYVVSHFRDRGVSFVDELAEVPEGATLLFSAHGVSPEIRRLARERKLRAIDATCPLVTKVHLEAIKYAEAGYTSLLIGHEGHDEVIGTMGEAPEAILLVERPEDVATLQVADENKVAYLTQTTLSVDDANRIIGRLKERFPRIAAPPKDDICYATQNRQNAVKAMCARGMDLLLVVGSRNSSNAARLVETATVRGVAGYLIDGPEELDPAWIDGVTRVGVTGGASTPDLIVQRVIERLRELGPAEVELCTTAEESTVFQIPEVLRGAS